MPSSASWCALFLFFMFFHLSGAQTPEQVEAAACTLVVAPLIPCVVSIVDNRTTSNCCNGVELVASLENAALLGKLFVCRCLKNVVKAVPPFLAAKVSQATARCSDDLRWPTATTNCLRF